MTTGANPDPAAGRMSKQTRCATAQELADANDVWLRFVSKLN
jgi:hypothetical protein